MWDYETSEDFEGVLKKVHAKRLKMFDHEKNSRFFENQEKSQKSRKISEKCCEHFEIFNIF